MCISSKSVVIFYFILQDQKLFSLRQKIESLKNKEDDPTEEEPDFMKDREKPILEHQLHHMKGNKRPVRQELAFMKHKIDSMQKEIDTFKDKALSRHRDPSSSSEVRICSCKERIPCSINFYILRGRNPAFLQ